MVRWNFQPMWPCFFSWMESDCSRANSPICLTSSDIQILYSISCGVEVFLWLHCSLRQTVISICIENPICGNAFFHLYIHYLLLWTQIIEITFSTDYIKEVCISTCWTILKEFNGIWTNPSFLFGYQWIDPFFDIHKDFENRTWNNLYKWLIFLVRKIW